jgi:hypothetical protein
LDENSGAFTRDAIIDLEEIKGTKLYQVGQERLVRTAADELLMEAYKKDNMDVLVRIKLRK